MIPTIVTAFHDIGRDEWFDNPIKTETYIKRFKYLCALENPIIIYTDYKFVDIMNRIKLLRRQDLEIVYENLYDNINVLTHIEDMMDTDKPEYIYLKNKKIDYVRRSIVKFGLDGYVGWVNCGLIRSMEQLPKNKIWDGDFRDCVNVWTQCKNDDFMNRHDMANTYNFISTKQQGIDDSIIVAPVDMWDWLEEQNDMNREWCRRRDIMTTNDIILTMSYKYFQNKDKFIMRYGQPKLVDSLNIVTKTLYTG